jgi:hypothetical protein
MSTIEEGHFSRQGLPGQFSPSISALKNQGQKMSTIEEGHFSRQGLP